MKLKAPDAAATARSPICWFPGIFLATSLTIISASAATDAQTSAGGLNSAEKWVAAQVSAGEIADLSKKFPTDNDRKLSAHFLEELLAGSLSGVKPHRNGVRIICAIIDEPIDLGNSRISCELWLGYCKFNSSVTFSRASFAGVVSFDGSRFKEEATFTSMKVGHVASFSDAVFEGPVDFVGADITSEFHADGAHFQNKEKTATFNSMKAGVASFKNAVFEGPVNFVGADIASEFHADGARFRNKEKIATFGGMKVRGYAFFTKAVFEGPVHFIAADIAGNFEADRAQFQNKQRTANFTSMKVGADASFKNAVFEGPVDFDSADIAGEFGAQEANFQNREKTASFSGMKVRGYALFSTAVFEGPVDFSYADFAWLDLSNPFWPKVTALFHMQGMSYKYIRAVRENEPESHKALLRLADQSAYTADVYGNLEDFFLHQGHRDDADRAFIAGKRRERKENLHGLRWLWSFFLDGFVGYGRRPWQACIPCAAFVVLGCFLFSPKKMELQKPEDTHRVYSPFWYSLGLFLPFVDLQVDKVWKPKDGRTFLRNYMRVHILLGWILIPIALAALTGLIK